MAMIKFHILFKIFISLFFFINICISSSSLPQGVSSKQQQQQHQRRVSDSSRNNNHTNKNACPIFIWDLPSAFRYHLCKRLLRDCLYEGKGGKKFVRIKPWSILDALYPLSQHAPDRCMICHSSYHNHMNTWWVRRNHLHSPYDSILDTVYLDAININNNNNYGDSNNLDNTLGNSVPNHIGTNAPVTSFLHDFKTRFHSFSFHRAYVHKSYQIGDDDHDSTHNYGNNKNHQMIKTNHKSKQKNIQKSTQSLSSSSSSSSSTTTLNYNNDDYEYYENRSLGDVQYLIPEMNSSLSSSPNLLNLVRAIVLEELDCLIWLQNKEKSKYGYQS